MSFSRGHFEPILNLDPGVWDEPIMGRSIVALSLGMKVTALNLWIHRGVLTEFEKVFGEQSKLSIRAALYLALIATLVGTGLTPKDAAKHAFWVMSRATIDQLQILNVNKQESAYFVFSNGGNYKTFKINEETGDGSSDLLGFVSSLSPSFIIVNLTHVFNDCMDKINNAPKSLPREDQYLIFTSDDL